MDLIVQLSKELKLPQRSVASAVDLLDAGNTIPFIARYRKEVTGELDENQLRSIEERLSYLRSLEKRKEEVLKSIAEQGKLTPELEAKIQAATILQEVEDLYLPYRPKRRTRASVAKEKGLEPLAEALLAQPLTAKQLAQCAEAFINPDLGVQTMEEALAGAQDIIAERVAEDADHRRYVRNVTYQQGVVQTKAVDQAKKSDFEMYYEYQEPLHRLPPHRVLAINRGEAEGYLQVKLEAPDQWLVNHLQGRTISHPGSAASELIMAAVADGYKRLIAPSIERELRSEISARADEHAIRIFATNLRNLLLQPPVRGQVVMGVDPAYRTGCKVAVVDETGRLLALTVVYPTPPQQRIADAEAKLLEMIERYEVDLITIGNGTASRETEQFVADMIKKSRRPVKYTIVNEAGASVYSASKVAGEEFPKLDVSERSAISIARRLQDPLAELVKIDPKSIGVGLYQHDVNQKSLGQSLEVVVESVVNAVGVDLNTASASLLQYVAGLKATVAKNIISHRDTNGKFGTRAQLKKVPRLGDQTFVQAAGFLRISDGDEPLDNTSVHPEAYQAARQLIKRLGYTPSELLSGGLRDLAQRLDGVNLELLAAELGIGVPTLRDMIDSLQKPGRDPRDTLPPPIFSTDVLKFEDLSSGMILDGVVRNVVDFGAFVDIGVHQDGLVHVSELSERRVTHPTDVVRVGDTVRVMVIGVDMDRHRISLSLKRAKNIEGGVGGGQT